MNKRTEHMKSDGSGLLHTPRHTELLICSAEVHKQAILSFSFYSSFQFMTVPAYHYNTRLKKKKRQYITWRSLSDQNMHICQLKKTQYSFCIPSDCFVTLLTAVCFVCWLSDCFVTEGNIQVLWNTVSKQKSRELWKPTFLHEHVRKLP